MTTSLGELSQHILRVVRSAPATIDEVTSAVSEVTGRPASRNRVCICLNDFVYTGLARPVGNAGRDVKYQITAAGAARLLESAETGTETNSGFPWSEGPGDPDFSPPWPQGTQFRVNDIVDSRFTGRRATVLSVYQHNRAQKMSVLFDGTTEPQYRANPASFQLVPRTFGISIFSWAWNEPAPVKEIAAKAVEAVKAGFEPHIQYINTGSYAAAVTTRELTEDELDGAYDAWLTSQERP